MGNTELITWKTFKETLLQHAELDLEFEYAEGRFVNAAYHITEIKQAPITSVDCGGVLNSWTEIIVQLWVPAGEESPSPMKVNKALSIISTVERMLPLHADATVKIEFGSNDFDTRQMLPRQMLVGEGSLTISLKPDAVQCKAETRGDTCGTTNTGEECCAPATEKPKIKLINLAKPADACCTPGGGCC